MGTTFSVTDTSFKTLLWALSFLAILTVISCGESGDTSYTTISTLNEPLEVKERYGLNRVNEPVTYGIPISEKENITNTSELSITGTDAQFRVLSRYNGLPSDTSKPIRMVLADFKANVNANATATYYFTNTNSGTVSAPDLALKQTGYVEINTGKLKLFVKEVDTSIFDEVWVDINSNGAYEAGEKIIDQPAGDGLLINAGATTYVSGSTRTVTIEENGPLRCTVKITGEFGLTPAGADNSLSYTIRIIAFRDKSYVKVQATLENENRGWSKDSGSSPDLSPVESIYINSSRIKTTLNNLGLKTVQFGQDHTQANYTSGFLKLFQDETSDGTTTSYSWQYNISGISGGTKTGIKFDNAVDIRNSQLGLMVASRWFWQNYPKGISVSGNEVNFELWPDVATDHRILGGIWKTHELMFYFHGTDTNFNDELATLKSRLIAKATDKYYSETNFFPWIVPGNVKSSYQFPAGENLQYAIDAQAGMHQARYNSSYAGSTIRELQQARTIKFDASHYASWYGWLRFGNTPRGPGWGYSSQHYGWSYIPLMGFLRFGNYEMLDVGEEFVSHRADIIVIHDMNTTPGDGEDYKYAGGQRYESSGLLLPDMTSHSNSAPRKASHTWTKGLALQYLLTGEERYRESLLHNADHLLRVKDLLIMTDQETRNQGRGILSLLNGYLITGESKYLMGAYSLFDPNLLKYEGGTGDGTSGWILSLASPDKLWFLYDAILVEPLVKLHYTLKSAGENAKATKVRNFLFRWGNWMRNEILPGMFVDGEMGTYRNEYAEYYPYTLKVGYLWEIKEWAANDPNQSVLPLYSDLFASLYKESHDIAWLNLARNIFKDYYIYQMTTGSGWKATFNGKVTPVGIENAPSANAYLKHGKSITKPMFYLLTEYNHMRQR
ncbi:MAG: hypothetical protein OEV42_07145 [Deltaproteobacteria bacterium]|nr:hypothetical protein [Deltaproteobacteria bacterium]